MKLTKTHLREWMINLDQDLLELIKMEKLELVKICTGWLKEKVLSKCRDRPNYCKRKLNKMKRNYFKK
jgi:hypothetical protein